MNSSISGFWKAIKKQDSGCWEWTKSVNSSGYGMFCVNKKRWLTHRLAYTLSYGDIPTGRLIMHSCDNPKCCNPDHLRLGTQSDNIRDAIRKGRWIQQKLTKVEHSAIKDLLKVADKTQAEIADIFGITQSMVSKINNGFALKEV